LWQVLYCFHALYKFYLSYGKNNFGGGIKKFIPFSLLIKSWYCWVPVAHACNPSYIGSRDQEDHGSRPAWANSLGDSILKKTHHKKRPVEWLKIGPDLKPQYCKKGKKKKERELVSIVNYEKNLVK
jgi:hypothetical protein